MDGWVELMVLWWCPKLGWSSERGLRFAKKAIKVNKAIARTASSVALAMLVMYLYGEFGFERMALLLLLGLSLVMGRILKRLKGDE